MNISSLLKLGLGSVMLIVGLSSTAAFGKDMKNKYDKNELKKQLSALQYQVTQEDGTERPFKNEYWDNKESGIYVDIVSGEALFSSKDKFKSGTGWPSFTRPITDENVSLLTERKLWSVRTEVRSKNANSHLGHVFDDGPAPTGKRYCINSASLRFVASTNLKKEGYEKYVSLFADASTSKKSGMKSELAKITFAGGCFWCMEPPFEKLDGVKSVISGYMGGHKKDPTYPQVSRGSTGHAEVVQVTYDPAKVDVNQLLDIFWMNIDPTDKGGQFVDRGTQYRSGIFYHNESQKKAAEKSKVALGKSGRFKTEIISEITAAEKFYPAEDYHQDYYKENPIRYKYYRYNSGRDQFLKKHWRAEKKT